MVHVSDIQTCSSDEGVDQGRGIEDHSDDHLYVPLEISSRSRQASIVGESSDNDSPSRSPPATKVSLGISRKDSLGFAKRRRRRRFFALCLAVGTILVASAALFTMEASRSSDASVEVGDDLANDEPNPPTLPASMKLFHPPRNEKELEAMRNTLQEYSDPMLTLEEYTNATGSRMDGYPGFTFTTDKHFSSQRTALLFAPGVYRNLDFEVGYYTSVLGLGAHPDDVKFTECEKGPNCPALEKFTNRPPWGSGLDTFWRSIENIATEAADGMQWVVSQAAPLRRMHVQTDLNFFEGDSWVSGGVAANIVVDGQVDFGGQQQWLMRNAELKGGAVNGAWSLVLVGCVGKVPEESSGKSGPAISVEDRPAVRVEKPYIVMRTDDRSMARGSRESQQSTTALGSAILRELDQYRLELYVPAATFGNEANGPLFDEGRGDLRDFRRVKLGVPSNATDPSVAARENHSTLQKALDEGKDLVLSPGIYPLADSLVVKQSNQVILGLGYATLVAPESGAPCMSIQPQIPGVRIAGLMLEASSAKGETKRTASLLLEWGSPTHNDPGDASNPGVLSDVFARVGGVHRDVSTNAMIQLHSGNIYGDNLWLWRADHVQLRPNEKPNFPHISTKYRQTERGECEVKNGLVVGPGASNVTIVGLAVEHTTEDQTVWNGDDGRVYFYQCELPYDVDRTYGEKKHVGYRVGPNVTKHEALGLGIYSNFRDYDVKVDTAVVHPESDGIQMRNIFSVKLDNQGLISSIVNGKGPGPAANDTERGRPYRCTDQTCSDQQ